MRWAIKESFALLLSRLQGFSIPSLARAHPRSSATIITADRPQKQHSSHLFGWHECLRCMQIASWLPQLTWAKDWGHRSSITSPACPIESPECSCKDDHLEYVKTSTYWRNTNNRPLTCGSPPTVQCPEHYTPTFSRTSSDFSCCLAQYLSWS